MLRSHESYLQDNELFGNGSNLPWIDVIQACFALQMVTLLATVVLSWAGIERRKKDGSGVRVANIVHSCATASLLSTSLFLLVPKSLEMITRAHYETRSEIRQLRRGNNNPVLHNHTIGEHAKSSSVTDWFVPLILAIGFVMPILLHHFFPTQSFDDEEESGDNGSAAGNRSIEIFSDEASGEGDFLLLADGSQEDQAKENEDIESNDWVKVVTGDCFHNFTDGIFLGTGFLLCGNEIGYPILVAGMHHQLGPKFADFEILTATCGFEPYQALALNFFSGFCIHIGCVFLTVQDLDELSLGFILVVAAGVYIVVGFRRFIPRVRNLTKSFQEALGFLICVAIGAAPLALSFGDDVYCGL